MRRILLVGLLVLAGCGGGNSMSDTVRQVFDENPDDVERVCTAMTQGASSKDDALKQLDDLDPLERSEVVTGLGESAGDGIPADAGEWTWAEIRDFYAAVWDECD